ncbi:hypothetical protein E2C01_066979 [Portunus trituberculatus]|uniref:Uncharacterized protein n=1 Tax=Portunus trituberculatus TaxID=210409 RepID=A0A5B7HTU6_PORTR|nr:hypothetical protein [Portunus trituberculatus]
MNMETRGGTEGVNIFPNSFLHDVHCYDTTRPALTAAPQHRHNTTTTPPPVPTNTCHSRTLMR